MLESEVLVTGEVVRREAGTLITSCVVDDEPVAVTVTQAGGRLSVAPDDGAVVHAIVRRFHLDLDGRAVEKALEASLPPSVRTRAADEGWVRRPAAAGLWPYCLVFLSGGNPWSESVRGIFADLGRKAGPLQVAPRPDDILAAGQPRLASYGIAGHRVGNMLGLAAAFATHPGRYDEEALRALPAADAVKRLGELPHIGATRARAIASTALGHDDVLPDLSRRDERLRRELGTSWPQLRAAARLAAPYRSVLGDTLLELVTD
jgi:3-methyladenine DNA glycosylase/8-oxoguanine DNA glycosylase